MVQNRRLFMDFISDGLLIVNNTIIKMHHKQKVFLLLHTLTKL